MLNFGIYHLTNAIRRHCARAQLSFWVSSFCILCNEIAMCRHGYTLQESQERAERMGNAFLAQIYSQKPTWGQLNYHASFKNIMWYGFVKSRGEISGPRFSDLPISCE